MCMVDAISFGEVFVSARFQMKKQNAEQNRAKKKRAIQAAEVDVRIIFASPSSSNMKAAIVSSKNPIAIDQKVIFAESSFPVSFFVKITERAKHRDETKVRSVPDEIELENWNANEPLE